MRQAPSDARSAAENRGFASVGLSAPTGDATLRSTHENLAAIYSYLFTESP